MFQGDRPSPALQGCMLHELRNAQSCSPPELAPPLGAAVISLVSCPPASWFTWIPRSTLVSKIRLGPAVPPRESARGTARTGSPPSRPDTPAAQPHLAPPAIGSSSSPCQRRVRSSGQLPRLPSSPSPVPKGALLEDKAGAKPSVPAVRAAGV